MKSKKSPRASRPTSKLEPVDTYKLFMDKLKAAVRKRLTEAIKKDKNSVRFSNALKVAFQKRIAFTEDREKVRVPITIIYRNEVLSSAATPKPQRMKLPPLM